jgi:hydrophobe/amphiphile efflux-1 (HAE1) family protein
MNLIRLSLNRPVFAWTLMFSLIVFGAIAFNRLGVSQMPDIDFPVIDISVNFEGADPAIIEAEIIDPLEARLLSIEGLKEMRSTARQGTGSVRLDLQLNRNVDVALQEVISALSQLRLPVGADPPIVRKTNPEEEPILFLGVAADRPFREVLNWVDGYMLDQFRFLPGVGEVSIGGFSVRNLRLWVDPEAMRRNDFTVLDLIEAINTQHIDAAAGQIANEKQEWRVRWQGEAMTVQEVENIKILRRGGQVIQDRIFRIKDLARVEDGLSDIRRISRFDGKEALAIAVRKQRGSNEVEVARGVQAKLDELRKTAPSDFRLRVNADFTQATEASVATTTQKLWMAAVITIVVCFLFLGSWQAALNILFSIPTSVMGTFLILLLSGFTLNLFTLLALTLAVSIVVDDAIMLLENIVRHHRMGKSPAQAAFDGSMEVLPAAIAATLAVVAVFLPVIFMSGVTGRFFFQFGVTLSAAVLLSLLESVTITPMRAAATLRSGQSESRLERWLEGFFHSVGSGYSRWLAVLLKRPRLVLASTILISALPVLIWDSLRKEFVPAQDQNLIILSAQLPPGSPLERTVAIATQIESILNTESDIDGFFISAGAGGPSASVNAMFMPIVLKDRRTRERTHLAIMDSLRAKLKEVKGARVTMRDVSARNLTTGRIFPVSFNLSGPDLKKLDEAAQEIMKRLDAAGLAKDLDTDFKQGLPEIVLSPKREAMAARGVSVEATARTINVLVGGLRQSRFTADGRRHDIRIKLPDGLLRSPADVERIQVRNNFGNLISLSEIVDVREIRSVQSISRLNRQRTIGVFGALGSGQSQARVLSEAERIAREVLPEGYGFRLEGASAGLSESLASLGTALWLGVLVAFLVLAVQFNSFLLPIPILIVLPFGMAGAIGALWASGHSLNLFSFIGIIVLMGIAKKNSIMLVEFANQLRNQSESGDWASALCEAGAVRLRPILMTSVATVAAALPLVIGNSVGQETRSPMGWTIIGGSIVSTTLTLVAVPCLTLLLGRWIKRSEKALV